MRGRRLQGASREGREDGSCRRGPGTSDVALNQPRFRLHQRATTTSSRRRSTICPAAAHRMARAPGRRHIKYLKRDERTSFSGYGSSYALGDLGRSVPRSGLRPCRACSPKRGSRGSDTARSIRPPTCQTALIDDSRSLDRIGVCQDWTFDASRTVLFSGAWTRSASRATYDYLRVLGARQSDGSRTGRTTALPRSSRRRADSWRCYFAHACNSSLAHHGAGARLDPLGRHGTSES